MFVTDSLDDLAFILEFNLPKEVFNTQEHIKLYVHQMNIPAVKVSPCFIGYKSKPIKMSGEIHCAEFYTNIKDVLPFINKWTNNVYCAYNKPTISKSSQLV